jgi:hypothetical protein
MTKGSSVETPEMQELTVLDTGARAVIGWRNDEKAQVDDLEVHLEQDGRIIRWSKEERDGDPEAALSSILRALNTGEASVLSRKSATEFSLRDEHGNLWLDVGPLSVYIVREPQGVRVRLYPLGLEEGHDISRCYASDYHAEALLAANRRALEAEEMNAERLAAARPPFE